MHARDEKRLVPGERRQSVVARPEVLAKRLANRGRESAADIARRLERAGFPLPGGLDVCEIDNSGDLDAAMAQLLAALQPVRA